ncbi:MAG: radical SAM protein [Actinobacteria bacterium]|nr:radical SAM protein [Actinomycetota bacterium]
MIGISKLVCGSASPGDVLRYGRHSGRLPPHLLQFSEDKRPVVVWNATLACNLSCAHCYADALPQAASDELTTAEAHRMLADLAAFGVPVVLFSGGEPLVRPDIFELMAAARELGMRAVLSTNGVVLTDAAVEQLRSVGVSYVGVSIDGREPTHDRFRGRAGAHRARIEGIRRCLAVGLKVGLRFTLVQNNQADLPWVVDLLEAESIPRLCVYHLAYTGRGARIAAWDVSASQSRATVEYLIQRALDFHRRGLAKEILTVANHADAVYVLLWLQRHQPERAPAVEQLLRWNGGNGAGVAIGCVDHRGDVHHDQFWRRHTFGNVRQRPFGDIWSDSSQPLLAGLKHRRPLLKGRCAACRYVDICNGNLRSRAEEAAGDVWAPDPACYLTDEEIGVAAAAPAHA